MKLNSKYWKKRLFGYVGKFQKQVTEYNACFERIYVTRAIKDCKVFLTYTCARAFEKERRLYINSLTPGEWDCGGENRFMFFTLHISLLKFYNHSFKIHFKVSLIKSFILRQTIKKIPWWTSPCGSVAMNPTSVHEVVGSIPGSLSGLRIWYYHELWCRSQTQFRSHVAVVVV